MDVQVFDIIVVGGGHAGIEAAWAASQFKNLEVAMISKEGVPIGSTPCNPAVGGVGKGQLVREIDAMGGLMGLLADKAAIQCRKLNESKGYAVQSTRFQIDKDLYPKYAQEYVNSRSNLTVIKNSINKIIKADVDEYGYSLIAEGAVFKCRSLVVTVGTFLDGRIHRGMEVKSGGRDGVSSSSSIDSLFASIKKLKKKFKTGTPARIDLNSINFNLMEEQKSDSSVENFHVLHGTQRFLPQVSCFKTRTTKETISLILENKHLSPMFNGQIEGVGPRYCPSIEDKVFRYPERFEHHVFVEPEGLNSSTAYPNGISTSLPVQVQEKFIASIVGFEKAEIKKHGYAVEYEVIDTSYLSLSLEHQDFPLLFFAGQVNGTSGYEEAAGQGLVAGLNSAQKIQGRKEVLFPRGTSYLGVLIDDVVGVRRDEPYRLFTARSENRLYLREDNVVDRVGSIRLSLSLDSDLDHYIRNYLYQMKLLNKLIPGKRVKFKDGKNPYILDCLKDSNIDPVSFLGDVLKKQHLKFLPLVIKSYAISAKYEGYLKKSEFKNAGINRLSSKKIDWASLSTNTSISNECRQRILQERPKTFFQLKSIPGIRPATITYVANGVI